MRYVPIDWKNIKEEYGPVSEKNKEIYQKKFRQSFNKVNEEICEHIFKVRNLPNEIINKHLNAYWEVFSNKYEFNIFYFGELLSREINTYKRSIESDLEYEIFKIFFVFEKKLNGYRVEKIATEDDNWGAIKKGDTIFECDFSEFKSFDDFFQFFLNVPCQRELAGCIMQFRNSYKHISVRNLKEALNDIEEFIDFTGPSHIKIKDAFKADHFINEKYEYLKLTNGYFESKYNSYKGSIKYPINSGYGGLFNFSSSKTYAKYVLYREWLKEQLKKISNINNDEMPKDFNALFKSNEIAEESIKILQQTNPPILNNSQAYIGNYKGVFCIWIEELKRYNLINHYSDSRIYAKFISEKFHPFSISGSMFGKSHERAKQLYQKNIRDMIKKLYQDYQ